MEKLSIQDHAAAPSNALGPAAAVPAAVQGAPQLPPQMFTTAAQLLDLTDSKGFRASPPVTLSLAVVVAYLWGGGGPVELGRDGPQHSTKAFRCMRADPTN